MTKKDYVLIAEAIVAKKPRVNWVNKWQQYRYIVYSVASALQTDDTRFDRDKFFTICGLTESEAVLN